MVVVVVAVAIILGTDVLHLVDAAALGAPLDGALTGQLDRRTRKMPRLARDQGTQRSAKLRLRKTGYRKRKQRTYTQPDNVVRVRGIAGAAGILLVTGRTDQDGVVERACSRRLSAW